MRHASYGQKSAAIHPQPVSADRYAADRVQSNILAAKAELISDKKSLLDTVPSLKPFYGSARDLKRAA